MTGKRVSPTAVDDKGSALDSQALKSLSKLSHMGFAELRVIL